MVQLTLMQKISVWLLPVLFAITVHEVAHGWVASKLGDKTALMMGRITLNPFKHIDIIGTVIVPALLLYFGGFVFGWAKPVPVNFSNLKRPRRDMALVALAGPCSNLLMAFIWAVVAKVGVLVAGHVGWSKALIYMGQAGVLINVVLMVLNLVPIPPLDGSRVVSALLPDRLAYQYNRVAPFGFFILLALIFAGLLSSILMPAVMAISTVILLLVGA